MITDALVNFKPPGANIPILAAAVASNVFDILGLGQGIDPRTSLTIGNATNFGSDIGIGGVRPQLEVSVGTAFVTGAGATLTVAWQAAEDPGSAGNWTPAAGDWVTLVQSGAYTAAQLTAGQFLARFDWPPAAPPSMRPRFYRLNFTPSAAFTAGTVAYAVVTMGRPDNANRYATKNFTVA